MTLTPSQFRGLHYINLCQGEQAKFGAILSRTLLDVLIDKGLVTECDGAILLSQAGEREFERLCSKRKSHIR